MKTEMPVRISLFHTFDEARPIWRAFEADGIGYAFQTYDWQSHWFAHLGKRAGLLPCLVAIEDCRAGRLMFLPLAIRRHLGSRCLAWLGGRHADYHAPLLGAGYQGIDVAALWPRLLARLPEVDVVHLEKQPADILGIPNPFLALGARPCGVSAYAARLAPSWEAYYGARRGAKTRATDRRKLRRLQDLGTLTFRPMVEPAEIDPVMRRLADLKLRQLSRVGGRDLFGSPGCLDFYSALAAGVHERLRVMVSTLELDGAVIAAHWGVVAERRFYWLIPVYDDTWRAHSPGLHLMHALMEWCCANGLETFDFGLGDEDYKTSWCDTVTPLHDTLVLGGWRGGGYVGEVLLRRQAREAVRRLPLLAEVKKALRRCRVGR